MDIPKKISGRKPDSEAGCIFENFTPKQFISLKILVAGTHNHGMSLPPLAWIRGPADKKPSSGRADWDKNLSLLCEAVDQYALQWAKREMVDLSVLSSWKEMIKGQIEERISKLKQNFKQPTAYFQTEIELQTTHWQGVAKC